MSNATLERTDHELVAAVRSGDERAFEALYERYHRRIYSFVLGMVKDHGRAEDVTQEVFVSALRRMRATERPIAFKPWIYEIAKNACIDAFRRARRAEEVSYHAENGLSASDHRRLVVAGATPDAALAAKEELQTLCGAFGGLSDAHHEILVMRELEGLSYREIGERMGMSRPAVESTLFRARRRLTEEYGELVSGERCRRVQAIIAAAAEGSLGARDARRLARHVAHCQPCRREALGCGLDRELIARPPLRRRVASKVGSWLPLPAFLRGRRGGGGHDSGGVSGGAAWASHMPAISDQVSAGWAKVAAGVAFLLAGVGAGVGMRHGPPAHAAPAARLHNADSPAPASGSSAAGAKPAARYAGDARAGSLRPAGSSGAARTSRGGRRGSSGATKTFAPQAGRSAPATTRSGGGGGAPQRPAAGPRRTPAAATGSPRVPAPQLPRVAPKPVQTVRNTVQQAGNTVQDTVGQAGNTVQDTAGQAGSTVEDTVGQAGNTVQDAAGQAGNTAQDTVQQAGNTVQDTVGQAGNTVQDTVGRAGNTVQDTVGRAGNAVQDTAGEAGSTVQDTVQQARNTVQDTVGQSRSTVQDTVGQAGNTVQDTVDQAGQTAQDAAGAGGGAVGDATDASGAVGGATGSLPGVP